MMSPEFSLSRAARLLTVALEALFIVGMIAGNIGVGRYMVMERAEARIYLTLSRAGLLAFMVVVAVDICGLFSPGLRRFALFALGRLLLYLIIMVVLALLSPLP